jgi:hypothetical protein
LTLFVRCECFIGRLVDADGDPDNGVQPECTVSDRVPDIRAGTIDFVVPECAKNGNAPPCWTLVAPPADVDCPADSHVLDINRGGDPPPANAHVAVECSVCADCP